MSSDSTVPHMRVNIGSVINGNQTALNISLVSEESKRTPCTFICIIDVSGSMDCNCSLPNPNGEDDGLSRLDLIKHALRTLIELMNENDHIALVTFSSSARVVLPITRVDPSNRAPLISAVGNLSAGGSTNIWSGVKQAYDLAEQAPSSSQTALLLFTDGQATESPPRGLCPTILKYISQDPARCSISCFGFGYDISSSELIQIARSVNGVFGFIPDATMVGTIFINFLSGLLSCVQWGLELSLRVSNGTSHRDYSFPVPFLHSGSSKDFLLEMDGTENIQIENITVTKTKTGEVLFEDSMLPITQDDQQTNIQLLRKRYVTTLDRICSRDHTTENQTLVNQLIEVMSCSELADHPVIEAYLGDLKGQVLEAVSSDKFMNTWGRHYLPSLMGAHRLQICNNFRDPGVQVYSNSLFKQIQDLGDDIFINLPPPTPTANSGRWASRRMAPMSTIAQAVPGSNGGPVVAARKMARKASMTSYHSRSGVCFAGECRVTLNDGSIKMVKEVQKGDVLLNGYKVVCVVKSMMDKTCKMVRIDELIVTPYHPIKVLGKWTFPCEVAESFDYETDFVYNFVLSQGNVAVVEGVECVTLGHGLKDDEVTRHCYFDGAIVKDLEGARGFTNGEVVLKGVKRCISSDMIVGLVVA
ncbi:hypothetical protein RCL1_006758 [Eukaryota sp. TZLM3-RCL]